MVARSRSSAVIKDIVILAARVLECIGQDWKSVKSHFRIDSLRESEHG
jgi:hypothetical protein